MTQSYPNLEKVLGQSIRSKYTIVLDENLIQLKPALKAAGFKVLDVKPGTPDEDIFELAETCAILTKNRIDFKDSAKAYDFDLIDIKNVQFIDTLPAPSNKTVQKIIRALRESKLAVSKGNFHLKIYDNGDFDLEEIVL